MCENYLPFSLLFDSFARLFGFFSSEVGKNVGGKIWKESSVCIVVGIRVRYQYISRHKAADLSTQTYLNYLLI